MVDNEGKDAAANTTREGQVDVEMEEDEGVSAVFVAAWCSNAVPPGRTWIYCIEC